MHRIAAALALSLSVVALSAPGASAAVQPYGTNDAGGFRNVLPPGANGLDNLAQLFAFKGLGALPPHFADQQPLYEGLLYAAPTLTDAQLPAYFKDATFGVAPGEVESTVEPRPGVTIVRDSGYGVPHVYGETRADTMFGAGYAGAADRLFLMDVLRHMGRAELSSFLGGSNAAADAQQWGFAPYTEADLGWQLEVGVKRYGQRRRTGGRPTCRATSKASTPTSRRRKPTRQLKPAEYTLLNKPMEPWKPTDVIAIASLIGGIFGRGGGNELGSAQVLQALRSALRPPRRPPRLARLPLQERPGSADDDLQALPLRDGQRLRQARPGAAGPGKRARDANGFGRRGRRLPARSSSQPACGRKDDRGVDWGSAGARPARRGARLQLGAGLRPALGERTPDRRDGPPGRLLRAADPHGGGPARAGDRRPRRRLPGVNLYVELGHGSDYAWSATSAGSDNVDTFAEVLCHDRFHYLYRGRCRPMERLDAGRGWTPNAVDSTPAGSQTLTAYRTVHGIVFARGKVGGRSVAFVHQRSTYFHEADSVLGFAELNEPGFLRDAARFKQAVAKINFTFNWAYLDSEHIAYALSGWMPQRAAGTSPDFPILGSGRFDWKGFRPASHRPLPALLPAPAGGRSAPSSSPGTTSRRPAGRRPTTTTPTARSSARR